jgi:hypothetical protein
MRPSGYRNLDVPVGDTTAGKSTMDGKG